MKVKRSKHAIFYIRNPDVERGLFALKKIELALDNYLTKKLEENGYVGRCDLCGHRKKLLQDHDHDNGLCRGKLCHGCNLGLGVFKDDPFKLYKAIEYLKKWRLLHSKYTKKERKKARYRSWRKSPAIFR